MKDNQEIQDKIDRFLLDQMSTVEKQDFIVELDNDPDLQETVEIQRLLVEEIKQRESFMTILEEAEDSRLSTAGKTNSTTSGAMPSIDARKSFRINYFWVVSIAAAIIGIVFIVWQPHKSSNSNIYTKYAHAFTGSDFPEYDSQITTRGGDIIFENLNPSENNQINKALSLYYNEEYSAAKTIFEQVLIPKKKCNELVLYMAISELYSYDTNKAIDNLVYLNNLTNYRFTCQAAFYLALAYIKTNQTNNARKLLLNLKDGDSEYAICAAEILAEMRWF